MLQVVLQRVNEERVSGMRARGMATGGRVEILSVTNLSVRLGYLCGGVSQGVGETPGDLKGSCKELTWLVIRIGDVSKWHVARVLVLLSWSNDHFPFYILNHSVSVSLSP
jgi:hypothetical protein